MTKFTIATRDHRGRRVKGDGRRRWTQALPGAALGVAGAAVMLSAAAGGAAHVSTASTVPAPAASTKAQLIVSGHPITHIKLVDRLIPSETFFESLAPRYERAGKPLSYVVDAGAVSRGYAMGFTTEAAANAFMRTQGMGTVAKGGGAKSDGPRVQPQMGQRLGGDKIQLATCYFPNHKGALYDGLSCTGTAFSVLWGESVPNLGTYGFNDKASSAAFGDCIANFTMWTNNSYSGTRGSLHGGDVYTVIPSPFGNSISSYKTDTTGPCL